MTKYVVVCEGYITGERYVSTTVRNILGFRNMQNARVNVASLHLLDKQTFTRFYITVRMDESYASR